MVDVVTRPTGVPSTIDELGDRSDRESTLLVRVAAGDEGSFRLLVGTFGPIVLGMSRRIIGDRALAEEATQETFLQVWREAAGYDAARASARTWILTIAHRRAVDAVRREQSQRRRTEATLIPEEPDIGEEVVAKDWATRQIGAVRTAIAQLSPEQRTVLTLMYFDGMSQSAISRCLSVPLGTVKSRTRLGMQRLRSLLATSRSPTAA